MVNMANNGREDQAKKEIEEVEENTYGSSTGTSGASRARGASFTLGKN